MKKEKITNPKFVQDRITELRLARDISEYKLSYIQSISSGKSLPSITSLYKICDYFEITLREFFDAGSAPDSKLVHDLILEIRRLPAEEQYFLYYFLLARKKEKDKKAMES